jgi:cob(I)alamin adenosyltransferase
MPRFYTQTGDDGYTGLLGDTRTAKYDQRVETIGVIDEANAAIGVARSISQAPQTSSILLTIQRDLYHLMTEIASQPENASHFQNISNERVDWLEAQIAEIGKNVSIPDEFIVPGDSKAGAAIDLARTIIRRAERHIARLLHTNAIENRELLRYMNRLSSLCFALELLENQAAGTSHPTLAKE